MYKLLFLTVLLPFVGIQSLCAMRRSTKPVFIDCLPIDSSIVKTLKPVNKPTTWHSSSLFKKTTQESVMPLIGQENYSAAFKIVQNYNKTKKNNRSLFNQKQSKIVAKALNTKAQESQKAVNLLTTEPCRKFALMPLVAGTLVAHPALFEAAIAHPFISVPLAFTQVYGLGGIIQQALLTRYQYSLNKIVNLQKELSASSSETKELSIE